MAINAYDRRNFANLNLPTFQELVVVPEYLTQQHETTQQALLDQLALNRNVSSLLREDIDRDAIDIISEVDNTVNTSMDDLLSKGYSKSRGRENLIKAKRIYNDTIIPIEASARRRAQASQQLRELALKDQTLLYNDPMNISVLEGVNNPNAYNIKGISGAQLAAQVAQKMKPLADYIFQDKPELLRSGLPYQWFTMIQRGVDPNTVAQAIQREGYDPTKAGEIATQIHNAINDTLSSNGVYDMFANDPEKLQAAWDLAATGAYSSIGTKQFGNMADIYSIRLGILNAKNTGNQPTATTSRTYPSIKIDDKKGKSIDNTIGKVQNTRDLLSIPATSANREALLAAIRTPDEINNSGLGKLFGNIANGLYTALGSKIGKKDLQDLLIRSADQPGDTVYEQILNQLYTDRNRVAEENLIHSTNLATGTNIDKVISSGLPFVKDGSIIKLDENFEPDKELDKDEAGDILSGDPKSSNLYYAARNGGSLIYTNDKGEKYLLDPNILGKEYATVYNYYNTNIQQLFSSNNPDDWQKAQLLARELINATGYDTNALNKVLSATAADPYN